MISIENVELKHLSKEEFLALPGPDKYAYAYSYAVECLENALPNFDTTDLIIERQSVFDDDWYLWTVAAKSKTNPESFGVWTMNLSIGGLHHGHYDLTPNGANDAIQDKH